MMKLRWRTHTDDVLEAIERGININVIRELGVLHDDLMTAQLSDYGQGDTTMAQEVAKKLKLKGTVNDNDVFEACYDCIRYRLTGHRKQKIKIASS